MSMSLAVGEQWVLTITSSHLVSIMQHSKLQLKVQLITDIQNRYYAYYWTKCLLSQTFFVNDGLMQLVICNLTAY